MPEAPLKFETIIDPNAPAVDPNAVSFETGATMVTCSSDWVAYEHHQWPSYCKGALTWFYEDLVMGRAMPLKFVTHSINDIDTIVAMALFLHRDIALAPNTASFVTAVDSVHRWGLPAFAHIPLEVGRLIRFVREHVLAEASTDRQRAERLSEGIGWVREYLVEDRLPHLVSVEPDVRIIDVGSQGFVVASCDSRDLLGGWVNLFRSGYLRGLLFGPDVNNRRPVLVARKSEFLTMDLSRGATLLNELESAYGDPPVWRAAGDFLFGPPDGTVIPPSQLIELLLRV